MQETFSKRLANKNAAIENLREELVRIRGELANATTARDNDDTVPQFEYVGFSSCYYLLITLQNSCLS